MSSMNVPGLHAQSHPVQKPVAICNLKQPTTVNYTEPNIFINPGMHSPITSITTDFVKDINDMKDFSTLREIYTTMRRELNVPEEEAQKLYKDKDNMYLKYTAEDYIKNKTLWGCTSYAVVYAQMARAKGIPALLVEGVNIDYVKHIQSGSKENIPMGGHWYVEVYIQGKWYLINSTTNEIVMDYEPTSVTLPDNNMLLRKGMDVYDMTQSKTSKQADEVLMQLIKKMPVDKYETNKVFDYVSLGEYREGQTFIVGSKKAADAIRQQRGIKASGSSIDYFLENRVENEVDKIILLLNMQTDRPYLEKIKQRIPGFESKIGIKQYEIEGKNYTVIMGKTEQEIITLVHSI